MQKLFLFTMLNICLYEAGMCTVLQRSFPAGTKKVTLNTSALNRPVYSENIQW